MECVYDMGTDPLHRRQPGLNPSNYGLNGKLDNRVPVRPFEIVVLKVITVWTEERTACDYRNLPKSLMSC